MNCFSKPRRTIASQRHPSLERLEPRCVLSPLLVINGIATESPLAMNGFKIESFAQLGLGPDNLAQEVFDPGQLALLSNPTPSTQVLVLTFNKAFPPAAILGDTLGFDVQLTDANNNPVIDVSSPPPWSCSSTRTQTRRRS